MRVSLIVASDQNGIIGNGDRIPWRLSGDMRHFKRTTSGHTLIMGRKTFDSIGKPLPGRKTVVMTRNRSWSRPDVLVAQGLPQALEFARVLGDDNCFVAGGGEIYRLALPYADDLHWTRVEASVEGDVSFPDPGPGWELESSESHPRDEKNEFSYRIEHWIRS